MRFPAERAASFAELLPPTCWAEGWPAGHSLASFQGLFHAALRAISEQLTHMTILQLKALHSTPQKI